MNHFEKYAELLIHSGLNVQKGQPVIIKAPVEVYAFVQILCRKAYEAGASDVKVLYRDEHVLHQRYLYGQQEIFETIPSYETDFYNMTSEQGAAYLTLVGEDPDLMKDVDIHRITKRSKAFRQATKAYRHRLDFMECPWCIAAVSTKSWANKVYPGKDDAMNRLWQAIFKVSRIDEDWEDRKTYFASIVHTLNMMKIRTLHYKNSLGTDLTVSLPEGYRFAGGGSTLKNGLYYYPNIPTEEVFSAPYKYGVDGTLYSSMPLNYNGSLVQDFWFRFEKGKVIECHARKGKHVLESILDTDDGSRYLGELALVPYGSPIQRLQTLFYETLIDENASCHFALGQSYAECLENGLDLEEEALAQKGLNQSSVHVDFMVGTEDLQIDAYTESGEVIRIFENGKYSSVFE